MQETTAYVSCHLNTLRAFLITLAALKLMTTGDPLDAQRDTGPRGGVKVDHTPEEEDSDIDFY